MTSAAVYNPDIHISGDVRIDPRAVIAPGVIIQAAPNSYVAIAPGVCLGMGAILQAHQGNIEIHEGAMIGAGVLVVGHSIIGENACIGYGTTVFRSSIAATTIIPPGSLIGDTSRQESSKQPTPSISPKFSTPPPKPIDPWKTESSIKNEPSSKIDPITDSTTEATSTKKADIPSTDQFPQQQIIPEIIPTSPEPTEETQKKVAKTPVVGQVYINQLLMTLFPQNHQIKPLNNQLGSDQ